MGVSTDFNNTLDDSAAVEMTGKIMVAAIIVLFLVVVFVLFLHLYAKWFWWRVEDPTHPPNSSRGGRRRRRRLDFASGQQDPAAAALRRGLDPALIRSLPVLVFRSEEFKEGLECAVCLSELAEGEKARMLPKCNHGFHVDCIDMWFQSHSTCPLCRNSVAPPDTSNTGSLELSHAPPQENPGLGGYSTESPNFPTNVLFWGNQTQVSSGALCLDEGPSSQSPCLPSSSSSSSSSSSNRADGMLVIDIPRQTAAEICSPCSPSGSRFADEETKSPMPTRLRSLKRLLSREKRVVASSPSSSVDVEQAVVR